MKLKIVEIAGKKYAEIVDDKPVYVMDTGQEVPYDAPHSTATITRLNGEAKAHREAKEAAELKLKPYEGIADPAAAIAAIETVANLDQGKLLTAGKVEEIKAAARTAAEAQVKAITDAAKTESEKLKGDNTKLTDQLNSVLIGGSFSRAKMITDDKHPLRLAIPADFAEAKFGKAFKVVEGKVVGYDGANPIYSRAKPGEVADFDEALEILVTGYPQKDQILRGTGHVGDGARTNLPLNSGGRRQMKRSEFETRTPAEKSALVTGKDAVQLVD